MLWLHSLLTHGAVFHEVADLATDAAAAVVGSHLSLGENFRIEKILLSKKKQKTAVSTIWQRKYTYLENLKSTFHVLTISLIYTGGKTFKGVPNTLLPLMKAFMMKLVTVLMI